MSNAGNTLYKGISEILDRTMAERRERAGEIGDLRAATTTQIAPGQGDDRRAAPAARRHLGAAKSSRRADDDGN